MLNGRALLLYNKLNTTNCNAYSLRNRTSNQRLYHQLRARAPVIPSISKQNRSQSSMVSGTLSGHS